MTPAEISVQIAKAQSAISASPAMEYLRQTILTAQRARHEFQEQSQFQRLLQQISSDRQRRAREMEARRLEEATQALDFSQRSRLRRVIYTWDQQLQAQIVLGPRPQHRMVRTRFGSFRSETTAVSDPYSVDLIGYLENAHRHPAIARRGNTGVRWWFDTWRTVAIQALREGLNADEVSTIVESVPHGKLRFQGGRPQPSIMRIFDWMRSRFIGVIHPNPPNEIRLHSIPVIGGEPVAIQV